MNYNEQVQKCFLEGDYEGVLSILKDQDDSLSLIYKLTAMLALDKNDEALDLINKHQSELEKDFLPNLIDLHISFLRRKLDIVGLMKAKEHYNDLPYHSQVVEEKLRAFDDIIKETLNEINRKDHKHTFEDSKKLILSSDMSDVYDGIKDLENYKMEEILPFILENLISAKNIYARSALLIFLGEHNHNEVVKYLNKDKTIIDVNPVLMMKNHTKKKSDEIINNICKYLDKDVTLENFARSLYTLYEMVIMPDYIREDDETFFEAIAYLSKTYMNINEETTPIIKDLAEEISRAISQ